MARETLLKSLVGSHNYNLNTKDSDKDYKLFVAPTFEDLYKGEKFTEQVVTATEDYTIHDIRKLTDLLFKANVNFLEVLASNEISIREDSSELEEILSLKNDIFKMNLPHLFNGCKGMHLQKMKLLDKGTEGTQHLVDEFGYDTKQALHAYRCMRVIVDFEETGFNDFEGAIRYGGEDLEFMMSIRNGFFEKEVFENFAQHYRESTFMKLAEKYGQQPVNYELKEHLESLVMKLVEREIKKTQ